MSEVDRALRKFRNTVEECKKWMNDKDPAKVEMGKDSLEDIDLLTRAMCDYTESVFTHNQRKYYEEEEKERGGSSYDAAQLGNEMERGRTLRHNSLVQNVRIVALDCRDMGMPEICGELPEEYLENTDSLLKVVKESKIIGVADKEAEIRHRIADWAWDLVLGATVFTHHPELEGMNYKEDYNSYEQVAQIYHKEFGNGRAKQEIQKMIGYPEK